MIVLTVNSRIIGAAGFFSSPWEIICLRQWLWEGPLIVGGIMACLGSWVVETEERTWAVLSIYCALVSDCECDQLVQALKPRLSQDQRIFEPWAKITPLSLKLPLSDCFIMGSGKETKKITRQWRWAGWSCWVLEPGWKTLCVSGLGSQTKKEATEQALQAGI